MKCQFCRSYWKLHMWQYTKPDQKVQTLQERLVKLKLQNWRHLINNHWGDQGPGRNPMWHNTHKRNTVQQHWLLMKGTRITKEAKVTLTGGGGGDKTAGKFTLILCWAWVRRCSTSSTWYFRFVTSTIFSSSDLTWFLSDAASSVESANSASSSDIRRSPAAHFLWASSTWIIMVIR